MVSELSKHWKLDPSIIFLNHGSFGACPSAVLDIQRALRDRMEAEPVRFFMRDLEGMLAEARTRLGEFLGADADDLAFVPNATTGVNAVVRSLEFKAGDEILTTDHAYNACKNALDYSAARVGAKVVVAKVPFPIKSPDEATAAIVGAATSRTRLALIDHITSPTALVFPVDRIVKDLAAKGIDTLVDGAHAPGMIPLDINKLGAAYYTGNCHKWLCAPKGAAFLHVRRDRQDRVRPHVISHGANAPLGNHSRFRVEFDWIGTDDVSSYLSIPAAINYMASLVPGGWPAIREKNRALALQGRKIVADALGVGLPCPDEMIGSIASIQLPDSKGPSTGPLDPMQDQLWAHHIEVPVMTFPAPPTRWIRISAQIYNTSKEYQRLADVLKSL